MLIKGDSVPSNNYQIDIVHKIVTSSQVNSNAILDFIVDRLNRLTSGSKILSRSDSHLNIKGIINNTNSTVGVIAYFYITCNNNNAMIHIQANRYNSPAGWLYYLRKPHLNAHVTLIDKLVKETSVVFNCTGNSINPPPPPYLITII